MPLPSHKVTICGIPELPQHCSVGVTHVLSIIDTPTRVGGPSGSPVSSIRPASACMRKS